MRVDLQSTAIAAMRHSQFRKTEDGSVDICFYDWRYYDSSNSDDINFPPLSGISYHHSPINLCTTGWARTTDTWFWRPVLYQLSYRRVYWGRYRNWTYVDSFADYRLNHSTNRPYYVSPTGIEPMTPSLKVKCSKPAELRRPIVVTVGFEPTTASVSEKNSTAELRDNKLTTRVRCSLTPFALPRG